MTLAPADYSDATDLLRGVRRRLLLARVAGILLAATVVSCLLFGRFAGPLADVVGFAGLAAAGGWVLLALSAARHGRRVREAATLAGIGRIDLAEGRATDTLGSFCLLRPVTLGAAAVLAGTRYEQKRHRDAAALASFVLHRRERPLAGERRHIRLLLGEALLAAGDANGARAAVLPLYTAQDPRPGKRLGLPEALRLLAIGVTIEARLGLWAVLHERIATTLPMVELMPAKAEARVTALLFRAAVEREDAAWSAYLGRRAALLAGDDLEADEPALHGWWSQHRPEVAA